MQVCVVDVGFDACLRDRRDVFPLMVLNLKRRVWSVVEEKRVNVR